MAASKLARAAVDACAESHRPVTYRRESAWVTVSDGVIVDWRFVNKLLAILRGVDPRAELNA